MTYHHTTPLHGDYLDRGLSPECAAEVDRHIAYCPDCRTDLERLRRITTLLKQVKVPDPGQAFFDNQAEMINGRLDTAGAAGVPRPFEYLQETRHVLRTLIRLAAVITLLFGAFYLSDVRQGNGPRKWMPGKTGSRYAQTEPASSSVAPIDPQTGINGIGSPSLTTSPADSIPKREK